MEIIDMKKIMDTVYRKKIYILGIIITCIILGIIYSFGLVKGVYKSSTTLILGRTSSVSENSSGDNVMNKMNVDEMKIDSNAISTYRELIKSNSSIKEIKDNLKLDISTQDIKKFITVSRVSKSDVIEIVVKHENQKVAADIANEAANVFSNNIKEIYKISQVYVIDTAVQSEDAYNVNHVRDIIIFVVLGIIISLIYVIIVCIYDTTIKTQETLEKDIGLKTLASIPNRREKKHALESLINFENEKSPVLEAFKTLRTNVQFTNIHNKTNKLMLVTSCFTGEGKSYVAANLACLFAKAGKKVILIDMDMRIGRQARIFGIPNHLGISNYLSNIDTNGMEINERINSYIKETSVKNLNVITSGTVPPNPSDLLSSEKLPELIKDLSIFYDVIMIDGAPVLPVADSLVLATMAGSTILVSSENKTKIDELRKAKRDLQNVGGRVIGVVLNQALINEKKVKKSFVKTAVKKIKENDDNVNKEKINEEKIQKSRIKKAKKQEIKNKIIKIKKWILEHINFYNKKETQLLLEQRKEVVETLIEKAPKIEETENKIEQIEQEKQKAKMIKEEEKLKRKIEEEKKRKEKAELKEQQKNEKKQEEIIEKEIGEGKDNLKNVTEEKIKDSKPLTERLIIGKEKIKEFFGKASEKTKDIFEKMKESFGNTKEKIKEYRAMKKIEQAEKQKQKDELKAQEEMIKNEELIEKQKEDAILAEIKEKERLEKEKKAEEEKTQKELLKQELKNKKMIEKEEKKKYKEQKRKKQKEEARIQEELLDDNLYPKTKYNKNL